VFRRDLLGFRLFLCRLLAREGINAEQLTRDLKSFELKVIVSLHTGKVYVGFISFSKCYGLS
jgi:hypothetical protein